MKNSDSNLGDKNIVLIGMPGAGKSSVGELLAKKLGRYFLDTDVFIQTIKDKSLQGIIDEEGLRKFREVERSHVMCIDIKNAVIATGGSVVYSEDAMRHLSKDGIIVYLDLDLPSLKKRIKDLDTRGVVMKKGQTLRGLYEQRQTLYRKFAEVAIDCSGKSDEQIAKEIIEKVVRDER